VPCITKVCIIRNLLQHMFECMIPNTCNISHLNCFVQHIILIYECISIGSILLKVLLSQPYKHTLYLSVSVCLSISVCVSLSHTRMHSRMYTHKTTQVKRNFFSSQHTYSLHWIPVQAIQVPWVTSYHTTGTGLVTHRELHHHVLLIKVNGIHNSTWTITHNVRYLLLTIYQ